MPDRHYHHGHKDTPAPKARRFSAPHPAAAPEAYPPAYSLRAFLPSCFDQGQTSTCFAHAQAALAVAAAAAEGTPLLWIPSPLGIARLTYCEEQTDPNLPLEDTGADMGDVMLATAKGGLRPLGALARDPDGTTRYSDVTSETVRLRPDLAEDELSAKELRLRGEQLQPTAPDFAPQCAHSLANLRRPLSIGLHSTPELEAWRPGMPALRIPRGFTPTDGHDVAMADYRINAQTGELEFWLRSSWSEDFGEDGGVWIAASWLTGGGCLEAWSMRLLGAAAGAASEAAA